MAVIRVDTYYDLTCDECGRSWSTDFDYSNKSMSKCGTGGMGMAVSKSQLRRFACTSGWENYDGRTLCPDCIAKLKEPNTETRV